MAKTTQPKAAKPATKATAKADTSSPTAQITSFTERITALTDHLQTHKKDHSGRRGLLQLVGKRRRLLDYLKKRDFTSYQSLVKKLGLRK